MNPLPNVTITRVDRQRLVSLATAALPSARDGMAASILLSEIARAVVVRSDSLPPNVVGMNCEIEVRDNIKNALRKMRIVYPGDEIQTGNEVSVLTPLGAALLGLTEGASIEWCTAAGDRRSFTVLRVLSDHSNRALSRRSP